MPSLIYHFVGTWNSSHHNYKRAAKIMDGHRSCCCCCWEQKNISDIIRWRDPFFIFKKGLIMHTDKWAELMHLHKELAMQNMRDVLKDLFVRLSSRIVPTPSLWSITGYCNSQMISNYLCCWNLELADFVDKGIIVVWHTIFGLDFSCFKSKYILGLSTWLLSFSSENSHFSTFLF